MLRIIRLFDLGSTTDYKGTDDYIRNNIQLKQGNAWALICSIFIASIGLNVNSTAVVIGAMLISPLMGPIIGAGYALGIEDLELFKKAIYSFLISVAISLATSTIYFLLSPFSQAKSELLARTQPTIYDLMIAAFGGIVGIVALSRSEKGNAIPGVAIATALMPPLCTVGFGLSKFDYHFFLGAGYLFTMNVFFIALSTFLIVRFLNFKWHIYGNNQKQLKFNFWAYVLIAVITLPSVGVAWYLKQKNSFQINVEKFIQSEFFENNIIVSKKVEEYDLNKPVLKLYTLGKIIDENSKKNIIGRLKIYGLDNTKLEIYDLISLSKSEQKDIGKGNGEIELLKLENAKLNKANEVLSSTHDQENQFLKELRVFNAKVENVIIQRTEKNTNVIILSEKILSTKERNAIRDFLNLKFESNIKFYRE